MQHRTRTALATVVAAALTGGLLTFTAATASAVDGTVRSQADFDKDGKGDIATSAPYSMVGGKSEAGQVVALYGTTTGVTATRRTVISQDTSGVPGAAEPGDEFGENTAYGDFDGDGYDDLAVGSPGEDTTAGEDAGSVTLLWGTASGLTGTGSVTVKDPAATERHEFGRALAAGDFDGDGSTDLAIGSSENRVHVYQGGFTRAGGNGGYYPLALATYEEVLNLQAGDVNGDRATDLVVNGDLIDEPAQDPDAMFFEENVLYFGGAANMSKANSVRLRPGYVTGIGDLDGDGFGDIVSGFGIEEFPGETIPYSAKGGKVWITYGAATGLGRISGITQDTAGVPGTGELLDGFGLDLDLGDVNGDTYLDVVVGVPWEDIDGHTDAGSVVVLHGSADGVTGTGAQSFHQGTAGVPGGNEAFDCFGIAVKLDDVTGDRKADLILGSGENGNGAVLYFPASGSKITTTGSRSISTSAVGVSTTGYPGFGTVIAD
jgi:hypothetical protein